MSAIKEKLHEQIEAGMRDIKLIPILFSTPMVQAILSGNKSMTRRTMKLQPGEGEGYEAMGENEFAYISKGGISGPYKCPYGQPGDVLWVREKFCNINFPEIDPEYYFFTQALDAEDYDPKEWKWKPGIHMPFEACRIFLRVKEIRVERLHDISEDDAIREGIRSKNLSIAETRNFFIGFFLNGFKVLWISINGADSWNSNPWVWVISFERITDEKEIADIRKQWNERRAK